MKTLLERGNTRLAPLDTVEPDAWEFKDDWSLGYRRDDINRQNLSHYYVDGMGEYIKGVPLYSGPKIEAHIESLLSQCRKEARKEALLEAADKFTGKEYYGASVQFELRRMAVAESNEEGFAREGEKIE